MEELETSFELYKQHNESLSKEKEVLFSDNESLSKEKEALLQSRPEQSNKIVVDDVS